ITSLDTTRAERATGVLLVLSHRNAPTLPEHGRAAFKPPAGRAMSLLQDDDVHYNRQPIAVVVADTIERAVEVKVEATYTTPMQNHNPIEPHATIAHWQGDHLTLYDSTQYVSGVRETVSKTLGISADNVRVISPFVGGGFGCKGSAWSHVTLAAMCARQVQRPVKLVVDRQQMFGPVGGRPQTSQHVALGA